MTNEAPQPAPARTELPPQGAILLIDKAEGWTSHDAVAKSRRALGTRKVGHAGTLDPMATGLLVLGAGPATRLLTHLVGLDKEYTTTIRLGVSTVTDDREGEVLSVADREMVAALAADPERIRAAVADLTGDIEQAPSAVSAIKVDGKRAYDRVRAGEEVELKKRPVTISAFEIGEPRLVEIARDRAQHSAAGGADAIPHEAAARDAAQPALAIDIDATVRCSSGTYIRALARDLGAALGVGGHLIALRRTEVGPFSVDAATSIADLAEGRLEAGRLLAPADVATALFPVLPLTEQQAVDLGNGKRPEVDPAAHPDAKLAAALAPDGRLVGLVELRKGRTRAVTNFPTPDSAPGAAGTTAGGAR